MSLRPGAVIQLTILELIGSLEKSHSKGAKKFSLTKKLSIHYPVHLVLHYEKIKPRYCKNLNQKSAYFYEIETFSKNICTYVHTPDVVQNRQETTNNKK